MSDYIMSPALVESGDIYVEVYPMKVVQIEDESGTESRLVETGEEPDFYDVWLRPDDWDQNDGELYGEWEDLSYDEAVDIVEMLEKLNPGIAVNWVNE